MTFSSISKKEFTRSISSLYVIFKGLNTEQQKKFIKTLNKNNFLQLYKLKEIDINNFANTNYFLYFYYIKDEGKKKKYILLNSKYLEQMRTNLIYLTKEQLQNIGNN